MGHEDTGGLKMGGPRTGDLKVGRPVDQ